MTGLVSEEVSRGGKPADRAAVRARSPRRLRARRGVRFRLHGARGRAGARREGVRYRQGTCRGSCRRLRCAPCRWVRQPGRVAGAPERVVGGRGARCHRDRERAVVVSADGRCRPHRGGVDRAGPRDHAHRAGASRVRVRAARARPVVRARAPARGCAPGASSGRGHRGGAPPAGRGAEFPSLGERPRQHRVLRRGATGGRGRIREPHRGRVRPAPPRREAPRPSARGA